MNALFLPPHAKVVELVSHNVTEHPTDIEQLCRLVGLRYARLLPERDWERKLQPLFRPKRMYHAPYLFHFASCGLA